MDHEKFFYGVIFIVDFKYQQFQIDKNFYYNLTRERQFVQFLHFRKDLSQTLPKYIYHPHQNSRKKMGSIYDNLAEITI